MQKKTNKTIELLREAINRPGQHSPSPFMNWLDPVAREIEYGSLTFEYTIRPEMTNPAGLLHGGVIAGIIDDLIGATVYSMEKAGHYVTVNLAVDYFSMALGGDLVLAKSRVVKDGRKVIHVECELWNPKKNRLLAKGHSNLMRAD